jgi:hypothetical protein
MASAPAQANLPAIRPYFINTSTSLARSTQKYPLITEGLLNSDSLLERTIFSGTTLPGIMIPAAHVFNTANRLQNRSGCTPNARNHSFHGSHARADAAVGVESQR